MAMVCPQCNRSYEQRLHCPSCEVRLLYQSAGTKAGSGSHERHGWWRTPWGIFIVGLLLAQGLHYVLRQLLTAGVLVVSQDQATNVWATLSSLLLFQALQGISVFAAGMLTGAGKQRGILFGVAVGMWNGILFNLIQQWTGQQLAAVSVFTEPILQATFGGLGGFVGCSIWKPISPLAVPLTRQASFRPVLPLRRGRVSFGGPVAWGRVLSGVTLAVGGVVWSDIIREFLLEASGGKLRIDTHLQAQLVTWEIAALAMLAGGALAGATTLNGLTQGLWVGIGSGTILMGIRLANLPFSFQLISLTLVSSLCLALVGGWFGAQLLPPLYAPPRRKRLLPTG